MNGTIKRVYLPAAAGLFVVVMTFVRGPGPHGPLRWVGLLLALLGLTGVMLARWTLGRSFSIRPQARELVTRGIYSKIRNPIYVSGCVLFVGMILIVREEFLWVLLALIAIVQVVRARREAHVLEAKFGEEYRRYRESTWF